MIVAALGGDGTVNAVAAALAGTSTPLLVLPAGTLNHFARDLGVPLDPAEAALLVRDGVRRQVDVGEVNGRVFVNNSSIGAYPLTVALRERLQDEGGGGKWTAMTRAAARTFRRYPTMRVRLAGDDGELALETPFVFVGNNVYADRGLGAPQRERLDAGCLGVLTVRATTRRAALRVAALGALGRLDDADGGLAGRAGRADGRDAAEPAARLAGRRGRAAWRGRSSYRSRPQALVVLAPPSATSGCSRRAR